MVGKSYKTVYAVRRKAHNRTGTLLALEVKWCSIGVTVMAKKPRYLNVSQAAKAKGVSRAAIYNAIRDKRLPAQKGVFTTQRIIRVTQKGWRILARDLADYQVSDLQVYIGKKTA
jgi:hypothetical protein